MYLLLLSFCAAVAGIILAAIATWDYAGSASVTFEIIALVAVIVMCYSAFSALGEGRVSAVARPLDMALKTGIEYILIAVAPSGNDQVLFVKFYERHWLIFQAVRVKGSVPPLPPYFKLGEDGRPVPVVKTAFEQSRDRN